MTDFATIENNYLSKLELEKQYNLGSIHKKLIVHGMDIEIWFLYINMMCSKKFDAHFPKKENLQIEDILMKRI
jgi:hypothetical protein